MDKGFLIIGGITIVVVGVMISIAFSSPETKTAVGETFTSQGQEHIAEGATHPDYNSNPPTSGWHYAEPASWGVKKSALPDERVIHNLEHGGIWISYQPQKVSAEDIAKLESLVKSYNSKVILTPRDKNDSPIALASWTHLQKLDSFDEAKIREFTDRNKNKGPENVPDDMPVHDD